eukprot:TRINITY_DN34642_c0_g1_i1.p1 TRINITY_DN34642_c0_g1~~TRINITY_DN34642_c0_g1_i1.p1  ORF type:complete len:231 (+),score=48.96 TRINITY_DN34642_c0_g1_i1:55-693(+)
MEIEIEKELQHVYDKIASEWDNTRRHPWRMAREWLSRRVAGEIVGEVGCGNGRNFSGLPEGVVGVGSDTSRELLLFVKGCDVVRCCATQLPFRNESHDHSMSIAVVHHLATPSRRKAAVSELARITKPGGSILLYVRSSEVRDLIHQGALPVQDMPANDIMIEWRRTTGAPLARYHHLFEKAELFDIVSELPVKLESFEQEKDNWVLVMTRL